MSTNTGFTPSGGQPMSQSQAGGFSLEEPKEETYAQRMARLLGQQANAGVAAQYAAPSGQITQQSVMAALAPQTGGLMDQKAGLQSFTPASAQLTTPSNNTLIQAPSGQGAGDYVPPAGSGAQSGVEKPAVRAGLPTDLNTPAAPFYGHQDNRIVNEQATSQFNATPTFSEYRGLQTINDAQPFYLQEPKDETYAQRMARVQTTNLGRAPTTEELTTQGVPAAVAQQIATAATEQLTANPASANAGGNGPPEIRASIPSQIYNDAQSAPVQPGVDKPGGSAPVQPGAPKGLMSSQTGVQSGTPVALNPFLMDQAKNIMEMQSRNLQERDFQNIRDTGIGTGTYGGDRQGIAEGVAMRGADLNTRTALANLFGNAYESQAGRDLSRYTFDKGDLTQRYGIDKNDATSRFGIATGAQTAAMNLQGQQAMANAQLQAAQENNRNNFFSTQRGQDFEEQRLAMQMLMQGQQGRLAGYEGQSNIYNTQNNAPWQQLQNYAGLASPFTGGGSSSTTQSGGPSSGQQAAQAAAQLAAMYMMYTGGTGSDKRMKKNIKRVGTTNDGLGEYEFEYKKEYEDDPFNAPGRHRGLMAQEVEKVYPEAVFDRGDGKKVIAYGLLGRR